MGKSTDLTSLGNRHKKYEAEVDAKIPHDNYIIIRLDGHGFSKFTRGLDKPFDILFNEAMVDTTEALIPEFNAVCGYTQSDEITLVIKPAPLGLLSQSNQIYNGRIQKLASLTAGFCSAYFNSVFKHPVSSKLPYFDSRAYGVPTIEEAYNSLMWRCRDAEKNSKNVFAQTYCSHKSLLNLSSQQQVDYCKVQTGNDWTTIPDTLKYGTTVYRIKQWVDKDTTNPKSKPAFRNRLLQEGLDLTSFNLELLSKILSYEAN